MTEDQKNRIREALRELLRALNDYGQEVQIDIRSIDATRMGDKHRRSVYHADLAFVQRETL